MEKQYTLPKEFGEKWVKALRSGEYKQGMSKYYNSKTDCYCAMGVAYKVNDIPFALDGQTIDSEYDRVFKSTGDNNLLWFPLQGMNDTGVPFVEIANWVEQNVNFI